MSQEVLDDLANGRGYHTGHTRVSGLALELVRITVLEVSKAYRLSKRIMPLLGDKTISTLSSFLSCVTHPLWPNQCSLSQRFQTVPL